MAGPAGTRKTVDEEKTAVRYDLFVLIIIALITPREVCASTTFRRYTNASVRAKRMKKRNKQAVHVVKHVLTYVVARHKNPARRTERTSSQR